MYEIIVITTHMHPHKPTLIRIQPSKHAASMKRFETETMDGRWLNVDWNGCVTYFKKKPS